MSYFTPMLIRSKQQKVGPAIGMADSIIGMMEVAKKEIFFDSQGNVTRRKLVSTNRYGTIVRPLGECCGRVVGCLATMVLWTVFDNKTTVMTKPSWHRHGDEASWLRRR